MALTLNRVNYLGEIKKSKTDRSRDRRRLGASLPASFAALRRTPILQCHRKSSEGQYFVSRRVNSSILIKTDKLNSFSVKSAQGHRPGLYVWNYTWACLNRLKCSSGTASSNAKKLVMEGRDGGWLRKEQRHWWPTRTIHFALNVFDSHSLKC